MTLDRGHLFYKILENGYDRTYAMCEQVHDELLESYGGKRVNLNIDDVYDGDHYIVTCKECRKIIDASYETVKVTTEIPYDTELFHCKMCKDASCNICESTGFVIEKSRDVELAICCDDINSNDFYLTLMQVIENRDCKFIDIGRKRNDKFSACLFGYRLDPFSSVSADDSSWKLARKTIRDCKGYYYDTRLAVQWVSTGLQIYSPRNSWRAPVISKDSALRLASRIDNLFSLIDM